MRFSKRFLPILLSALLLVSLAAGGAYAESKTLTGTGKGFGGDIYATLSVDGNVITACTLQGDGETESIGGAALAILEQQIVLAGGDDIDGVTGATFTSDGAREAVKSAMGVTGSSKMTPDTYAARAMGMNDYVSVEVTVTDSAIESVCVVSEQETPGIGGRLMDKAGNVLTNGGFVPVDLIPEQIVAYQSIAVDTVTGATITSNAILKAVSDALTQAGADPAAWRNEIPAPAPLADATADVVIVGAGGAGLAAAVSASQSGASVILVEKNGAVGGDTLVCGAIYNSPDAELQSKVTMSDSVKATVESALAEDHVDDDHAALLAKVKEQWDAYVSGGSQGLFDSAEWYALQTWNGGDKVGDLKLIEAYADNSYPGYEWITGLGMEFNGAISQAAGALWQRSHTSLMNMGTGFISTYLTNLADAQNVSLYVNTDAKTLITDEQGRVVGVVCEDETGNSVTFNANKGVVLSTGGFSANGELIQSSNTSGKWDDLSNVPTTNRNTCSQGDGIIMAMDIGAATRDMEQIQLLFLGNLVDGGLTKYPVRCVSGITETVFVNVNGERFVQEDGRRDQICKAVLEQPGQYFYIIESADGAYSDITDPAWRSADGFTISYLEENGYVCVGQTISELAEKLGIDPATLENTISSYNACADAGKDEVFGRTAFGCKLENGPFVATVRQACIHHTMGGVVIDTETHVLDANGNAIVGLFAAGEITGGVHGSNRLGGNAVTDTVVFGRLAGAKAGEMAAK